MSRWWNRQAQFSGLIDYQDHVRPAYFSFKLLSRLAGQQLEVNINSKTVHGFATHDPKLQMHNMLLWNFSEQAVKVKVQLKALPKDMQVRHIVLDAEGGGDDENQRLRPDPFTKIKKGDQLVELTLQPWAVHYWSFE
jgi:hypothetical protein